MGVNQATGYMGVCRQSAKGSQAAAAAFKFPVFGGGIWPTPQHSTELMSNATRTPGDPSITGAEIPVDFETRLYVGSAVALIHSAMGGISSSGAGDPYTHALSTSSLPYYSFYESIGVSDAHRFAAWDVKCSSLTLSWDGPGEIKTSYAGLGAAVDMTQADFDGSAIDETDGDGYFYPVGGTFEWDAVGTSGAAFTCLGGSIGFDNQLDPVAQATTIEPYDHDEGQLNVTFSLNIRPSTNLNEAIEILTGSTTGSGLTGDVQYGKVNLVFQEAGTGTHTLTITASRIPWTIEPIKIDANGKAVVYNVSGIARYNTTESDALDVAVTNANAAAVYNGA